MKEDEGLYIVQDDTVGPLRDEINLTEEERERVQDIKKKYGIK